eukprot:2249368-Karenia_brevis.AAC.1
MWHHCPMVCISAGSSLDVIIFNGLQEGRAVVACGPIHRHFQPYLIVACWRNDDDGDDEDDDD